MILEGGHHLTPMTPPEHSYHRVKVFQFIQNTAAVYIIIDLFTIYISSVTVVYNISI